MSYRPLPERAMICELKRALSLTKILPLIGPFDFDVKVTLKTRLDDRFTVPPFAHVLPLAGVKSMAIFFKLGGVVRVLLNVTVMIALVVFTF